MAFTLASGKLYRNNLKNRGFGKEASQNFGSEQMTIAGRQGMSENQNFGKKLTQPKPDSSSCFGMWEGNKVYETLATGIFSDKFFLVNFLVILFLNRRIVYISILFLVV